MQNGIAVVYASSLFNLDLTSALLFPLVSGVFVDRALPLDRLQSDRVLAAMRCGGASGFLSLPRRRKDTSFLTRLSTREPVLPGTDQFVLEDV